MTNWKRKLAAYLHDPPSKAIDIRTDRLDRTRICEAHARIIPLVPPGLIPEVDQHRNRS